jgi:uncharacterized protein
MSIDRGMNIQPKFCVQYHAPKLAIFLMFTCLALEWPPYALAQTVTKKESSKPKLNSAQVGQIQNWNKTAFAAYERDQPNVAARYFLRAAKAGDLSAKYNLASMSIREETRLLAAPLTILWLKDAATGGLAPAQFAYGLLLELGRQVQQDIVAANIWYEKAARAGHPEAALNLATACFIGRGHPLDYAKAAYWYERAADAGEVAAQYSIASMYLTGLGVDRDLDRALVWFSAAARQGDIVAKEQARLLVEQISKERGT